MPMVSLMPTMMLPQAFVAACAKVEEAAGIAVRHFMNRLHHFPLPGELIGALLNSAAVGLFAEVGPEQDVLMISEDGDALDPDQDPQGDSAFSQVRRSASTVRGASAVGKAGGAAGTLSPGSGSNKSGRSDLPP